MIKERLGFFLSSGARLGLAYSLLAVALGKVRNWPEYLADCLNLVHKHRVTYSTCDELSFKARPGTTDAFIISEVYADNYTPKGFEIGESDAVVDIGAHIGVFSLFASKLASKGRVYALEPEPQNFSLLKENIALNGAGNVTALNAAGARSTSKRAFFLSGDNTGRHSLYRELTGTPEKILVVDTVSLADFLKNNNLKKIDLLKIDCEGAEFEFLEQSPELLEKISKISLEVHPFEQHDQDSLKRFLEEQGFHVRLVEKELRKRWMLYAKRVP